MAIQNQMNQLGQTAIKGTISHLVNPNTIPVQVDPASSTTILPGDYVRMNAAAGSTILVDIGTAALPGFGFVIYSPKKASFVAGDYMEIALAGSCVYLEASGTIARNDLVEWLPASHAVKAWAGANPTVGKALDNATDGQLVRVIVRDAIDTDTSSSSSCRSSSSSCRSSSSSSSLSA